MKKKYLYFGTLVLLVASVVSCVKDDDLELLKHPIHVQGKVSPTLGVPVAYGELNFNELLNSFSAEYAGYVLPDEDILTLHYDTVMGDTIYATGSTHSVSSRKPHRIASKIEDGWQHKDTTIVREIDIDLFNSVDMQEIADGNIAIDHLWVDIAADIKALAPDNVDSVSRFVKASFDSLEIYYTGKDGVEQPWQQDLLDSIVLDSLLAGQHKAFPRQDLRDIVNSMPTKIKISIKMHILVSDQWVFGSALNEMYINQLMDSLQMTELMYSVRAGVTLPLSIKVGHLPYSYTLGLGDGISTLNLDSIIHSWNDGLEVDVKDSRLTLAFDNGIPFSFDVVATLLMADTVTPVMLSDGPFMIPSGTDTTISAALTDAAGNAIKATHSELQTSLNKEKIEKLGDAKFIQMRFGVRSAKDENGQPKIVNVRRDDFLKVKAYVQLHPEASADIKISEKIL